jgi:hypothetical protein
MNPPRLKLTTSDFGEYALNRRCGRPFSKAYYNDRRYLFFPIVFEEYTVSPKVNVTSMAVHRDICLAFFDDVKELTLQLHIDRPNSDPPSQTVEITDNIATRQTSSVYSTDTYAPDQPTIIENDYELAPGFESKALSMETFHKLEPMDENTIQSTVATFQASRRKPIVLFDLSNRSYAKFSLSSKGLQALQGAVTDRSQTGCCFFTFPDGQQCVTWRRHIAAEAAKETRLLVATDRQRAYRQDFTELLQTTLVRHAILD